MALTKFLTSMDIIAALNDEPNDVGGLTATRLKAKFDEGCKAIQSFVNGTLTVEADATFATKAEVQSVVLGQIPDGTITETKIANGAITTAKLETALATKIDGAAKVDDLIDTAINLSDAVKTALALTGTKYVSDALTKLSGAALRDTTNGNKLVDMSGDEFTLPYAKIATGSYTGTGTYGSSSPCSTPFDSVPHGALIIGSANGVGLGIILLDGLQTTYYQSALVTPALVNAQDTSIYSMYAKKSADGKTIYWYSTVSADRQLNKSSEVYTYSTLLN